MTENNHYRAEGVVARLRTVELARRLGLNPAYVKSAEYVEDGDKKRVRVEMRDFEVELPRDFDLDDDRRQLPDATLHMGNRSKNECYCVVVPLSGPHLDLWHLCAACSVFIDPDEKP